MYHPDTAADNNFFSSRAILTLQETHVNSSTKSPRWWPGLQTHQIPLHSWRVQYNPHRSKASTGLLDTTGHLNESCVSALKASLLVWNMHFQLNLFWKRSWNYMRNFSGINVLDWKHKGRTLYNKCSSGLLHNLLSKLVGWNPLTFSKVL